MKMDISVSKLLTVHFISSLLLVTACNNSLSSTPANVSHNTVMYAALSYHPVDPDTATKGFKPAYFHVEATCHSSELVAITSIRLNNKTSDSMYDVKAPFSFDGDRSKAKIAVFTFKYEYGTNLTVQFITNKGSATGSIRLPDTNITITPPRDAHVLRNTDLKIGWNDVADFYFLNFYRQVLNQGFVTRYENELGVADSVFTTPGLIIPGTALPWLGHLVTIVQYYNGPLPEPGTTGNINGDFTGFLYGYTKFENAGGFSQYVWYTIDSILPLAKRGQGIADAGKMPAKEITILDYAIDRISGRR